MPDYYVNMIDKSLSGWGDAEGGRSIYIIRCATAKQAVAAELAALDRLEMKYVRIARRPRRSYNKKDHVKVVDFYTLGGMWKKHFKQEDA